MTFFRFGMDLSNESKVEAWNFLEVAQHRPGEFLQNFQLCYNHCDPKDLTRDLTSMRLRFVEQIFIRNEASSLYFWIVFARAVQAGTPEAR